LFAIFAGGAVKKVKNRRCEKAPPKIPIGHKPPDIE